MMEKEQEAKRIAFTLDIGKSPASASLFRGLGMQTDCYIYDPVNRQFGVNDADYERWERRLGLLRPGLARIFLPTNGFIPSVDHQTPPGVSLENYRIYVRLLREYAERAAQ